MSGPGPQALCTSGPGSGLEQVLRQGPGSQGGPGEPGGPAEEGHQGRQGGQGRRGGTDGDRC